MRPFFQQLEGIENLVGVEVGVRNGDNALSALEKLSIVKFYLVDPYTPYVENWKDDNKLGSVDKALENLEKYKKQIVWMNTTSLEAASMMEDKSLDFVYLDGNHIYEFVKADIRAWLPKVKWGGLIGGHDYQEIEDPAVEQVVDEMFKKHFSFHQRDWWHKVT